ncbi:hypothetical protein WA158_004319 [Blastocystis sp. Blastoise]
MAPAQAVNAAKKVKGENKKKVGHIHTKVHFYLPKTLKLARNPKYARKSFASDSALDKFTTIKYPLTTETAMKKVELCFQISTFLLLTSQENTLVFIVDIRANKRQIAKAIKDLYNVEVDHVNTLIRPDGLKKAYVRLPADTEALDVATRIGVV